MGSRMEVPPPFASLQVSRGRRGGESLAGGAWRGLEERWGIGENF